MVERKLTMKTLNIRLRPDRLNAPLATFFARRLSSAVLTVGGDVPDDVDAVTVQIGRTADPDTHQPRPNFTAAATRTNGAFRCYLSPFHFPDAADGLVYHIVGTDANGNARWLGTGPLVVLDSPANGSPVAPEIVPADTYLRNPATGLYHRLTAVLNEDGELTARLEEEGIER